ncbi:MAG: lysophospholipid acyltransferase family protein [Proteobacteria bacterium]|nr:lysophospholipid acyltransferase family protein [Pseudomonadota bacterium]
MSFKKLKTKLLVSVAKAVVKLPLFFQLWLGRILGLLLFYLPNKRKNIAGINLALCFPELSPAALKKLLKQNLISTGQGGIEMIIALWGDEKKYFQNVTVTGFENLQQQHATGNGCLLLSCHTNSLELGIRFLNIKLKRSKMLMGHMLSRQHNNKLLQGQFEKARMEYTDKEIDKKDIRSMLKAIKSGYPVYYLPDQNFSYQFEYIKFFGVPAATTTAPVKLAQSNKLTIIPWFCYRNAKNQWQIDILPKADYFAELGTDKALEKMNKMFEQQIKKHPEQYLWVHRRFKNQADGKNIYTKK